MQRLELASVSRSGSRIDVDLELGILLIRQTDEVSKGSPRAGSLCRVVRARNLLRGWHRVNRRAVRYTSKGSGGQRKSAPILERDGLKKATEPAYGRGDTRL